MVKDGGLGSFPSLYAIHPPLERFRIYCYCIRASGWTREELVFLVLYDIQYISPLRPRQPHLESVDRSLRVEKVARFPLYLSVPYILPLLAILNSKYGVSKGVNDSATVTLETRRLVTWHWTLALYFFRKPWKFSSGLQVPLSKLYVCS